jgi:ATP-dependent protease ClpP protease subunit
VRLILNTRAAEIAAQTRKERQPGPLLVNRGEASQLLIYQPIGDVFGGVTSRQVAEALGQAKGRTLEAFISSEGGDIFEGMAIMNLISRFDGRKTAYVDGIAASAASVILMAFDDRVAMPSSQVMVHHAWAGAQGSAAELRKLADVLDQTDGQIIDVYARRCSQPADVVRGWLDAETYFTAEAALDAGLVDRIAEPNDTTKNASTVRLAAYSPYELMVMKTRALNARRQ